MGRVLLSLGVLCSPKQYVYLYQSGRNVAASDTTAGNQSDDVCTQSSGARAQLGVGEGLSWISDLIV